MKILVALKHVPDTEAKIKVAGDGASIDATGVKFVMSPYDEFALEAALRLREAGRAAEVVVVGLGPAAVQTTLRQGLAMGADRAIHVQHEGYERADGLARARGLAAVARTEAPGLVLLGRYGVGTDEGQTGSMVAELLDLPCAAAASAFELSPTGYTARREVEGAVEVVEGPLPAVITCDKGMNEPRYPSLKGIMAAKKKPLEVKSPSELGLDEAELGAGRRVVWDLVELPPGRTAVRRIEGDPTEAARTLASLLRSEAKVI
jgi:electron transfer flavoprotein beta subunit